MKSDHLVSNSKFPRQSPPDVEEIEELLRSFQPSPGQRLYTQVATADWMKQTATTNHHRTRMRLPAVSQKLASRWALAVLSSLLVITLMMFTPMGRSLAQSIARFFPIATSDQISDVVPMDPLPTQATGYPYNEFTLSIAQAEALAGFKVKELVNLPDDWLFHGARFNAENQQVILHYYLPSLDSDPNFPKGDNNLYVSEQKSNYANSKWDLCTQSTITDVEVNNLPAELADGVVWVSPISPTPGSTVEWSCEKVNPSFAKTLRWEESDLKYEMFAIHLGKDATLWLTNSDLINLAENMR